MVPGRRQSPFPPRAGSAYLRAMGWDREGGAGTTWPEAREQARACTWKWAFESPQSAPDADFVRRGFDKRGWPRGPWDDEPDLVIFASATKPRFRCVLWRNPDSGAFGGYVGLTKKHPLYGFDLKEPRIQALEVFSEVSFSEAYPFDRTRQLWYVGFTSDIVVDYCPGLKAAYLHATTDLVRRADLGELPNAEFSAAKVAEARARLPELRLEVRESYDVRRDTTPLRPKYRRYAFIRAETEKLAGQLAGMVRL